jgi:hypothetical protein
MGETTLKNHLMILINTSDFASICLESFGRRGELALRIPAGAFTRCRASTAFGVGPTARSRRIWP